MRILPSLLSHNLTDLNAHLRAAEPLFEDAQVDLMDGMFVPTKSVTAPELRSIQTPLRLEVHLMVQDPTLWIEQLAAAKFRKIIVHQEIGSALAGSIRLVKSLGLEVGLAINPDSDVLAAQEWWHELGFIQVMGVIPGRYGATFQPMTLENIRTLREAGFSGPIQVDGGVTPQTAPMLAGAGVKSLVVGSYLFGSEEAPDLANIGEKLTLLRAALGTP